MKIVALGCLALLLASALNFLLAFPVMWLWNWLMPVLFKLPHIGYWHAWGVAMLASLLFGRPRVSTKD